MPAKLGLVEETEKGRTISGRSRGQPDAVVSCGRNDMPMSLPEASSSELARELASEFDAWRRGVSERLSQPSPEPPSPPAAPPPPAPPQAAAEPQPAAEPQLQAEPASNVPLGFGPGPRPGAGEPLLKRSTPAAQSSASPEFAQSAASSATEEPGLPHRVGAWRLAGWAALAVGAPLLVMAMMMLAPAARPPAPTPLEPPDRGTLPRAPSAPAIPAADATTALPGEPSAPLPARPDIEAGTSIPPSPVVTAPAPLPDTQAAADASSAPPPATSLDPAPVSEAVAE